MDTTIKIEKKTLTGRKAVLEMIIFLCVLLFCYAAFSKLIAQGKFHAQIQNAPIIGPVSGTIIWAIPLLELCIALQLILPPFRLWGLRLFTGLMIIFTIYIGYIMWFAPHIPCSCGGVLEQMGWGDHLIFNILFILIGLAGIRLLHRLAKQHKHPLQWQGQNIQKFFRKKQGKAENL